MDDGRGPCVKEVQSFEDLPAPAADHSRFDGLQPFHVAEKNKEERLIAKHL